MTQAEINEILEKHKKWLNDEEGGECANLRDADLQGADLWDADLRYADLRGADLRYADLWDADLRYANLRGADLRYADLWDADIDYSCLPLWCGGLKMRICDRIAIQLLYHVLSLIAYSDHVSSYIKKLLLTKDIVEMANKFHKVNECGRLEVYKEDAHENQRI